MRRSRVAWAAAAVVVAGGGLLLWRALRSDGDGEIVYQTAAVTRGRLAAQVTASGTLSPLVTVQVGSQVSGRIKALHADFNSRVEKGQVIAEIDPQLFESDVAKARANLTAARAQVTGAQAEAAEARSHWQRTSSLVTKGLVSSAEAEAAQAAYETAKARVTTAQASMAQARAALAQSETNLAYTTIHSPISGIVISRNVDVGQTVAASLQAPTLFTIAEDLAKMEVHTSVAESDVGRLEPGMPVEFTVDAYPGERFRAGVKEVRYSPQTVQNVVTYDAVVSVDNPELKLRPGMTADVTFKIEERANALLVPNAALRFQPPPEVLEQLGLTAEAPAVAASREQGEAGQAPPTLPSPRERGEGNERQAPPGLTSPREGSAGQAPPGPTSPREGKAGQAAPAATARSERRRRPVWVLDATGLPRQVVIRIGISDGRNTEVVDGALSEGQQVIVGIEGMEPTGQAPGNQQGGPRRFGRIL